MIRSLLALFRRRRPTAGLCKLCGKDSTRNMPILAGDLLEWFCPKHL